MKIISVCSVIVCLLLSLLACQNEPDTNLEGSWIMTSWTCNGDSENLFGPNISSTPCDGFDSNCYYFKIDFDEEEYQITQVDGNGVEIIEMGVYQTDGSKLEMLDEQGLAVVQIWNQTLRNGSTLYLYGFVDFRNCSSTAMFQLL